MTQAQITVGAKDQASSVLARIRQELAGVESVSMATSAALSGLTAGAIGVLSVGGVIAYAKAVNDGVDALNDLSDATGTSIENASALEDVARRAGHSFENVTKTLVKFNDVLGKADAGSEAERIFKALGLSVEELRQIDPAEALRRVAVEFNSFADDGEKARAAQVLFGRSIAEVAPFLKDLGEQTKLSGTVTKEAAEEADRFNKNLAAMQKDALDVTRAIVGPLVSSLNTFFGVLKEGKAAGDGFFATMFKQTELYRIFSGRDFVIQTYSDIRKELELTDGALKSNSLSELQRQGLLQKSARLQAELAKTLNSTAGGGRSAGPGGDLVRPALAVAGAEKQKAGAVEEVRSAYTGLNKTIEQQIAQQNIQLQLGREMTAEERFIVKIRADAAASKIALTDGENKALDASILKYQELSKELDIESRQRAAQLEFVKQMGDARADEAKSLQGDEGRIRARNAAVDKLLSDMNFEASLIGKTNEQRELAIKQRELEAMGISKQSAEYDTLSQSIKNSLDVRKASEAAKKEFEDVSAVALDLFKGSSDSAKRYVQQIIDEFLKMQVIKPLLNDVFGINASSGFNLFGMLSGLGGGFKDAGGAGAAAGDALSDILSGMFSFDGGGYTGRGPRSGGMDGKGGFPAMLHPNEQVVDLTKGGAGGFAPQTSIVINGGGSDVRALRQEFSAALNARDEQWRRQLSAAKVI